MGKTGGGIGTNQYAVRGVSQVSRQGAGVLDDLAEEHSGSESDSGGRGMTNTANTTVVIDTTTLFHLPEPVKIQPTDAWLKYVVEAFNMGRQLGSSTGYEVNLWHDVAGELMMVQRTRKHIRIDGSDVTIAFGGKRYVVGHVA